MPKVSSDKLLNSKGHRIRQALDAIAGKPTGNFHQSRDQHSNTCKINYFSDDIEIDDDRDEWINAIIHFKREYGRNPDMRESLTIAKSLGYRKAS